MKSALSPSVVSGIHDLELAARLIVDGIRAGAHRSPLRGYSAEFQQHRPYRAGDDLKHLDWKLLARTDRLYTRTFREMTSLSALILLDTSMSMAFPEEGVSKFRYATIAAAALAHLIATQGDSVGMITMSDDVLDYLPARGGRPHLRALIARIDQLEPHGRWRPDRVIARGAELLRRRGLVIVISDFYDDEDATLRALRRAARVGHDVTMLQIVSPQETTFPYRGTIELQDLEAGTRRVVHASAIESDYRAAVTAFLERCRSEALRGAIDYALLSTDEPPERALRNWLLRRDSGAGASGKADGSR